MKSHIIVIVTVFSSSLGRETTGVWFEVGSRREDNVQVCLLTPSTLAFFL